MTNIELKIEGMHCTGCSTRLEKVLRGLDGVVNANVNFEEKSAVIEFDSKKITVEEIKEAVEDAGFKAK